jgi:uncharacterized protein (TIGR03546 family)
MGLLFKQIFNFLKLLNSDTGTYQLASGLTLGMFLGFSPFLSLQTLLVLFILFFFRIQIGAAFLAAFFFKFVAFLIDPVADTLGRSALEAESLRSLWVTLYNMPIVPMTRFNNSVVMGSFIVAIILAIPIFFIFKSLILKYRATVVTRFKQTQVWKFFTATKFYNWYLTYDKLYGA